MSTSAQMRDRFEASTPIPLPPPRPEPSHQDQGVPVLGQLLDLVSDERWTIAAFVALALLCGAAYALVRPPLYQSDALVQVEPERSRGVFGQLDDIPGIPGASAPSDTEIEILRSRGLLGLVVDELGLAVVATPRHLPVMGAAIARARDAGAPASAPPGMGSYAWGGEHIEVDRLDVPPALEGQELTLVAGRVGSYEVRGPGGLRVSGEVGRTAESPDERHGGKVSLFVTRLVAREGTQFTLTKRPRIDVVKDLQRNLTVAEKGRKTGVLSLSLRGSDPRLVARILDHVTRGYVRQNVERRSAEAEKTLEFVNAQLPVLKANVDEAEAAFSKYRATNGAAVDLSLESKALVDRAAEIEQRASDLALQRMELSQRFADNHPAVRVLRQKEAAVAQERTAIDSHLKRLPKAEMNSVRLLRDVRVANELYVLLLNKAQELRVAKSGTIGNVRVLDAAIVPTQRAGLGAAALLLIALLAGLVAGLAFAYGKRSLNMTIEDPDTIERELRIPVYATVPHSVKQPTGTRRTPQRLLAAAEPTDPAVESLRSLRASVQFAISDGRSNVVAIGGPTPGTGKSFVTANLAHVLAELGKRVVVVDADLRKGRLHRDFGVPRSPGLSELICGVSELEESIRRVPQGPQGVVHHRAEGLHVVPMGKIPPNPAELLSSESYAEVIQALSQRFDVVLLDTAPILPVADGGLAARAAGSTLVVVRAGHHSIREIAAAVRQLAQNGATARAFVVNDLRPRSAYARYRYDYPHQYRYA